jgi:N-glycosylase/DNA lyase
VLGRRVVRLRQVGDVVEWEVTGLGAWGQAPLHHLPPVAALVPKRRAQPGTPPDFLGHYLSLDRSLAAIAATFPDEPALRAAVRAHWGMRVARQEPWECLASFIASSTKQIVQIRQIVDLLARRFGEPVADGVYTFPGPGPIARSDLGALGACKLGFRAPHLLAAAQAVDSGRLDLAALPRLEYPRAREELVKLRGVGDKIAGCVLLFSCGFDQAFPVDVWVERALRRLYFPRRTVTARRVRAFADAHFGPHAGWAQQYLFFDERRRGRTRPS